MSNTITTNDVDYVILSKNESEVSIVVEYWARGYDFKFAYNLSLPIDLENHTLPTGAALHDLIIFNAPVSQLNAAIDRFKASVFVDFAEIDQLIATRAQAK